MPTVLKEKVISPCIKECNQNGKGLCVGCYRDILEITQWGTMGEDERKRIVSELPKREELYKKSIQVNRSLSKIID